MCLLGSFTRTGAGRASHLDADHRSLDLSQPSKAHSNTVEHDGRLRIISYIPA